MPSNYWDIIPALSCFVVENVCRQFGLIISTLYILLQVVFDF